MKKMKRFVFAAAVFSACAALPAAFVGCSGSAEIIYTLSGDGTHYSVSGVGGTKTSLKNAEIPATYSDGVSAELPVTEIGESAFRGCYNLSSVTLPQGIERIGDLAFASCAFMEFTIPDTVKEIGFSAFALCRTLKSIVIPESVTDLGDRAFYGCSSLTVADVKANITELKYSTFYNTVITSAGNLYKQTALKTVYLPATLTKVHVTALQGNILSDVYFAGTSGQWQNVVFYDTRKKEGTEDEYEEVKYDKEEVLGTAQLHFAES